MDDIICVFDNEHDSTMFFEYLNQQHPNIKFTTETEKDKKLPFLDILIDNSDHSSIKTSVFRKSTFTGLMTCFSSFTAFSYKVGLIKALIDRTYKINNTWLGFNQDIDKLFFYLKKNLYPQQLLNKILNDYLSNKRNVPSVIQRQPVRNNVKRFSIAFVGLYSKIAQRKINQIIKLYCKDITVQLAFKSFKVSNLFSYKSKTRDALRSKIVYEFICSGCNARYIGESQRHLTTRIKEHLTSDKNSHVYQHLQASNRCKQLCDPNCFTIIDSAMYTSELLIKESLAIIWDKPGLNKQVLHPNITLNV